MGLCLVSEEFETSWIAGLLVKLVRSSRELRTKRRRKASFGIGPSDPSEMDSLPRLSVYREGHL